MTGRTVHHYRVAEMLGSGGMGEVYRAEDTRLGRSVALKFLPASYQYDADRRERFFREARAASALRSPNIAAIYDIGEHEDTAYIVMEFVEGQLLSRKLEGGPLPVVDALDIAMQIADALDEAHSLGIVHRDIKSANVMITERGLVKVLDFGLAKVTGNLDSKRDGESDEPTVKLGQETAIGLVLGTAGYMSPEQALGRSLDHRSDLFSLGVVGYEMLTARLPFEGASSTELIDRIVHQEPAAVARFNYSVPHELERIVRKALEKDAAYRYQSAREIYIDLRNLRRDLEANNRTSNITSYPTEHQATALLPNSAALGSGMIEHPKVENAVAIMTFSNITREPADDWIGSGIAETVTADLKNVRGLSVIGRERIFELLKNQGDHPTGDFDETFAIDMGRRLGAAWLIGGGYQRVGEMLRITARFIDVDTGAVVKTVKIDGKISEIFNLQDRIVYELSQGLNLELGTSEITEIEREETQSVEAYENFSRGIINLRTASRDTLDRAIFNFETATEHDPNYARAWAALGAAYDLKGSFLSIPELSLKAIEFEKKAIQLNPRLSHAHQWLGGSLNSIGRYDEAIESIKEAIRLEPNNAGAHASLARSYWLGKGMVDEAITEFQHAIALNPEAGYAYLQLAFLYTIRGRYDRAEAVSKQAIELQERFISGREGLQVVGAHTRLGYAYYRQGRYDEAIAEYNKELGFLASSDHGLRDRTLVELDEKMGAAYLRKGLNDEAESHFKRALKRFDERVTRGADDPHTKYYIASLHALRGDPDRALKYLAESSAHLKTINGLRAKTDPDFESLRDDPRFKEIVG
ncbi:MAG TPA: protein kinase [Blastocatellia bacterium]|jgi:non-specific serine/threonine protein kinase|nr:protein kinase [Blastocatellia bacterium]